MSSGTTEAYAAPRPLSVVARPVFTARLADYLINTTPPGGLLEKTHEAVAADLGTSREVVSRLLKDFEQEGLVALSRGVIRVHDKAGLARLDKKS